ncbi:hypothetical protein BS47DRAFT_743652 [Hydnum rufescens UP504]|uniref:Secreted protein n=1 Tax=Hydnum rufescens UP504 TaxID=1448309 RepID=A0A9P6B1Q4_9AGAM|nr:hypothetical protein BS47DRAFT_743652 [Hydnum rufescens UP504]
MMLVTTVWLLFMHDIHQVLNARERSGWLLQVLPMEPNCAPETKISPPQCLHSYSVCLRKNERELRERHAIKSRIMWPRDMGYARGACRCMKTT